MALHSINPFNNELIQTYEEYSRPQIEIILKTAYTASLNWKETSFGKRSALLHKVAEILRKNREVYALLITREMGKVILESRLEIDKCIQICEYYAEHGSYYLTPETVEIPVVESYVRFDPLGVVFAVMPWNFPFSQVFRCAVPAIMAGNVVVLKHSSNVGGSALALESIFTETGVKGLLQTLMVPSVKVEEIISDTRIAAVSFTGSVTAGRKVAEAAGRNLKKVVLELGGSDPFIILADADLENAAEMAVKARFKNAGQACNAAKRFIVEESILKRFTDLFVSKVESIKIGNPEDESVQIGPQAREDLAIIIQNQLETGIMQHAKILTGGKREGCMIYPTVVLDMYGSTILSKEEVFGPVAVIICASSVDDAVRIANSSEYGLGASVWTKNRESIDYCIRNIESGSVFINEIISSDPRMPFGGVKNSGYGRELSIYGIREFVNIKSVKIKRSSKL